jgi:hypothetical protein
MHRATAAWCSLLASNRAWATPSTKRRAAAAQVVSALLDGPALEQVDRPPEGLLQRVFQIKEAGEVGFGAGFEFDQQVGIAALGVEVPASSGRTEDFQPADVEALTQPRQGVTLGADGGMHDRLRRR